MKGVLLAAAIGFVCSVFGGCFVLWHIKTLILKRAPGRPTKEQGNGKKS